MDKVPSIVIISGSDATYGGLEVKPADWKGKNYLKPSDLGLF